MTGTDAMRCKILENALKGLLPDTLVANEDVADLIDLLRVQKEEAIKKGLVSKDKKMPSITEREIPFTIPANWSWVRIGDIFYHNTGKALNSSNTEGNIYEYITTSNLYWDRFELSKLKTMPFTESEIEKYTVKKGDLLVCEGGDIGRAAIWNFDEEIKIQNHIHRLRPYVEICVRFYYYVFLYYKKIGRINGKGIGLQGLSTKALHGLIVPLPPKETQWKIAKKVDEIFEQLEIMDEFQRNYVADIKALKSKIFDAAIQGKLSKQLPEDGTAEDLYAKILSEKAKILERCKGREDKKIKAVENDVPFEIPDHWKWIRLGDIGLFKKGPFGSALTKAMFVQKGDDTVKVYEQQHAIKKDWELGTYYITREYFNEKMRGFEVMSGDIIVSCAGTIGETYIMPDGIEQGIINQALMRVTLAEGIEKKFFQYYFDANLKKSAQEESNGSAIKNIPSFDVLKNWYFPLTSIEEQRRIVSKIDEILACM